MLATHTNLPSSPQLVCPAGSLRALTVAVDAGANAVYLGLKDATNARNEGVYAAYSGQMSTGAAAYRTLQTLENTLVATHTDILSNLENHDAATLVASIITVEARHAAVFGVLPTLNLSSALDNTASSIAPGVTTTVETTVAP